MCDISKTAVLTVSRIKKAKPKRNIITFLLSALVLWDLVALPLEEGVAIYSWTKLTVQDQKLH